APASRQPQPERLRLRAAAVRAGRARHRLRARRAAALDPWALTQAGFWLSFMAVGLLMVSSPPGRDDDAGRGVVGWRRWPAQAAGSARQGLRSQVIATLGLTPLTLVFFQQVSIVGFAANLVAIPLVTLVV